MLHILRQPDLDLKLSVILLSVAQLNIMSGAALAQDAPVFVYIMYTLSCEYRI